MRKTLFVSICALALALGACTAMMSREEYGTLLGAWVGASEEALIRQFGVPTHSEPEDTDTKVIFWDHASVLEQTSGPSPVRGGVTVGFSMTTTYWCDLSFRIVDGIAEGYTWKATRDAVLKDEVVDHGTAFPCSVAFPPVPTERERKPWVGKSEAQLRGAYDQEPATYVLDGDTKFLTCRMRPWSHGMSRSRMILPKHAVRGSAPSASPSLTELSSRGSGAAMPAYSVPNRGRLA